MGASRPLAQKNGPQRVRFSFRFVSFQLARRVRQTVVHSTHAPVSKPICHDRWSLFHGDFGLFAGAFGFVGLGICPGDLGDVAVDFGMWAFWIRDHDRLTGI